MNLEEDAMLVAIGQMSMDEAREKWADDWNKFIQSLTRWKSVHQLFRLAQLRSNLRLATAKSMSVEERIKSGLADLEQIKDVLNGLYQDLQTREKMNETLKDQISSMGRAHHGYTQRKMGWSSAAPSSFDPMYAPAPKTRSGKQMYSERVNEIARRAVYGQQMDYLEHQLKSTQKNREILKLEIEKNDILVDSGNAMIAASRRKLGQLRDQCDITKTYAMGLLVADVFYSLAAALQGDIY